MTKPDPTESSITRLREASEWIQRLNESTSQAVVDQWLQWCKSDPLNLPTYERMQGVWHTLSQAQAKLPQTFLDRNVRKRGYALAVLAASIVLMGSVAGWFVSRYPEIQTLDSAIGQQRLITLADGSSLDLAPGSHVTTRFTLLERNVQLDRGQAFFSVAHSAVRPFIVSVNGLKVTAVGTAFDVRIDPSNTVVIVSEGKVRVAPATNEVSAVARTETIQAGVGQRVTFSKSARRLSVASVDPNLAGSWRGGRLQFVGEPLENVVGVVNRYGVPQIVVAPALQHTRFTGTISPTHVRDWLKALEQIYTVEMVDQGANVILIRSRTGNAAPK